MKKVLVIAALGIAGVASAFPFRTTCGVAQVSNSVANWDTGDLQMYLSGLNLALCGTYVNPNNIAIYYH